MTVFPLSDVMQQNTCFSSHVTSFQNFGEVISIATTALTVIVAIRRCVLRVMLWEQSRIRAFLEGIVGDFTEELWIRAVIKLS